MKNFKKILSIVLCMAMLISSALFVSAADSAIVPVAITELPATLSTNPSTPADVAAITIGGNATTSTYGTYELMTGGWLEYTVTTETEMDCFIASVNDVRWYSNVLADITINGTLVIDDVRLAGGNTSVRSDCGMIHLNVGTNTIRFTLAQGPSDSYIALRRFILEETSEEIESNPVTFPIKSGVDNMVLGGINTPTGWDVKINQTGSITKTFATEVEKEYLLQIKAGTSIATGGVLAVSVNGQSLGNFTVPNTGSVDTKETLTIGKISLKPGFNKIAISRPSTSTGGDVGVGSIILTAEVFELSEFTTNGETGITSVTVRANVVGSNGDLSATNAVIVVAMLDANGMILKFEQFQVQCAYGSVATVEEAVTTEGISGTVDKAQAFLWDCGAEASPSIFNTTMIELMPACESLND